MNESKLQVAILAGGRNRRMAEHYESPLKALALIGDQPIIYHIIERYRSYGFKRFLIAGGHKHNILDDYFRNHTSADWQAKVVDTGETTATGGRIKRLEKEIDGPRFLLTWCDGLADIDHLAALDFHKKHGRLATVTAVHPPARFGSMELDGNRVTRFVEKPERREEWINGAFFILEREVFDLIEGDRVQWEQEPMEKLAEMGELMAYRHEGFWQCMDTPKDHEVLKELWESGSPPWVKAD